MLALALVLEGRTRTEAAQAAGMDRQTLRDWVHRSNEAGLAGLKNRAGARGRRRKLTAAQEATFAAWVREGPKPDVPKVVCWRCRDLRDEIARHFEVEMHERTVGKLLARLNFSRVSVRPRHPEQDIAAQEAHKKTSPGWSPRPFPSTLEAQAGRTLVAGRGARRPAGKPDLRLGRQGQPPARAARSTLRFGLPVRRRLSGARRRRRTGAAVRQTSKR